MEKKFTHITGILDRLECLYSDHLDSFKGDELPDLDMQTRVRDLELKRLMAEISGFIKAAETNTQGHTESMLKCFHDRIADILEKNKTLERKVAAHKKELQKKMARVTRGRNAIGAYRTPGAANRVLSIAN
ncbi:MAG: hypothetical protein HUN04_08660 [Desulfobacter sp.]|nr:MAG: hypothetical protein HUN04_08660 [Desulfobacter sp.]